MHTAIAARMLEPVDARPGLDELEVFHAHRWLLDATEQQTVGNWVKELVKAAATEPDGDKKGMAFAAVELHGEASRSNVELPTSQSKMDFNRADTLKFFAPKKA